MRISFLARALTSVCRYALTLRVMLANLRRKIGPVIPTQPGAPDMMAPPPFADPNGLPQFHFTLEELGMGPGTLPDNRALFSPSAIPLWLQEQVSGRSSSPSRVVPHYAQWLPLCFMQNLTDLGLPSNGSDGIFLQMGNGSGWNGDFPPMPEAW